MTDTKKHHEHEPTDDEVLPEEPATSEDPEVEVAEPEAHKSEESTAESPKKQKTGNVFSRFCHWAFSHKKVSTPVFCVVVLVIAGAIPVTRYALAGLFLQQSYPVLVVDSETHKPVTSAKVSMGSVSGTTDNRGRVMLHVKVGNIALQISKKYYTTTARSVLVPLSKPSTPLQVELKATGRVVPLTVLSKVSKQPVANIVVKAEGSEVKTDKDGKATIVLPPTKKEVKAALSGSGFNDIEVTVQVTTDVVAPNTFEVTPAGKLYFLSNASGKIDLVKSDLDGGSRQTVLPGTGKEDKTGTVLLASRDWKYVALLSKRDGGDNPKLFLIETGSDKLTTMDEGDALFAPLGWSGDRFVYSVTRNKISIGQPKRQALKSYQASTKKITLLDETGADSNGTEVLGDTYVLGQEVVYVKNRDNDKQSTFNSIQSDGTQKKVVKTYENAPTGYGYQGYLEIRVAEFNEIYLRHISGNDPASHDEYKDGKLANSPISDNQYYNDAYLTYIVSPSGNKTFWTDYRDGKNVFFVGDKNGENGKQLAGSSDDYAAYGWYTDDYLLVTKKGSEMRIMPVEGLAGGVDSALKVSDYYKPNYVLRGYGYGYGG